MTTPADQAVEAAAFRKKPVTIHAVQWDGTYNHAKQLEVALGLNTKGMTCNPPNNTCSWWKIETLEDGHVVSPLDWIITGVKGEHYPCKPDIFELTYERANLPRPLEVAAPVGLAANIQAIKIIEAVKTDWNASQPSYNCWDNLSERDRLLFVAKAASRVPVAVGAATKTDLARIWRAVNGGNRWPSDVDAFVNAVLAASRSPAPAGVAGGVDASRILDKLRAQSLMVAVHNDYRLNGERHTFWLMTAPDGMSYKGEGQTDAEALESISAQLDAATQAQPSSYPAVGGSGGATQSPAAWAMVNTAVEQYVAEYEVVVEGDSGEGTHSPSEFERYMIADAIYGLLSDDDFTDAYRKVSKAKTTPATEQGRAGDVSTTAKGAN